MRKDEIRKSENFTKYMKYINSYEDGKYTAYEFEDEGGNLGIHYQLKPELLTDKKAIAMARLFNTKMSKVSIGDICIVVACCREIHEEKYDKSVFYLNVDRILKPLTRTKLVTKYYRGIPTEFAQEEHINSWDDVR